MKTLLQIVLLVSLSFSQTYGQIGFDNDSPDPSAVLDLNATDKGLLIPRMTTQEREAIASPANSLLVFDTSVNNYFYYLDNRWVPLNPWSASTASPDISYEGGNVGIGKDTPFFKLDVNGPVNTSALFINGTQFSAADLYPISNGAAAKTATGDWNDYTVTGFYSGINLLNSAPLHSNGDQGNYVTVIRHNSSYCIQYSCDFNNDAFYVRTYYQGTWSDWHRIDGIPYHGSGGDANDAMQDGYYSGRPFSANHPTGGGHGRMLVWGETATGLSQLHVDDNSNTYIRSQKWTGDWSQWKKVTMVGDQIVSVRHYDNSRYGYIELKRNDDTRGAYIGRGNGGSRVELFLDNASAFYINKNLIVNGTLTENSDIRLKDNIEPVQNALEKVQQIEGVYFTRKDGKDKKKREIGVIADDLIEVVPELVEVPENEEEMKSVNYSKLTALLIEAMKEQQVQIEALKAEIAAINGK